MTAPTHLAIALLFCACAQATPAGPGLEDDPADTPDARPANPETPDADTSQPDAAPGQPDAAAESVALVINEFVADHLGSDSSEFVEVFGDPNTDYSSASILVVEGDSGAGAGGIDQVLAVGTTGATGVFATSFGANMLENGTLTILLVDGFSGSSSDDVDADDDGQMDNEPWAELLDAIAVSDGGAGDLTYAGAAILTPDFDSGTLRVGGASRIPDGVDTDNTADWARNDFDGAGLDCCTAAVAEPGEALNTPGVINAMAP